MPRRHSMIQSGNGWIASAHLEPEADADEVEVKAKVVEAPTKDAPTKTAGAKTK